MGANSRRKRPSNDDKCFVDKYLAVFASKIQSLPTQVGPSHVVGSEEHDTTLHLSSPQLSLLSPISLSSLQRQGPDLGALSFLIVLFQLVRFHVELASTSSGRLESHLGQQSIELIQVEVLNDQFAFACLLALLLDMDPSAQMLSQLTFQIS